MPVAERRLSRLLGLALLGREQAGNGLLIPRCRAVHTVGMRFPLDLLFLGADGRPVRRLAAVRPGRLAAARGAHAVLETPSAPARAACPRPEPRR